MTEARITPRKGIRYLELPEYIWFLHEKSSRCGWKVNESIGKDDDECWETIQREELPWWGIAC